MGPAPPRAGDAPALVWAGKPSESECIARAQGARALAPLEVVGAPSDAGVLVRGDNLDALAALLATHRGRVNLAYLDPPFGTGDDFSFTARGDEEARVAYRDDAIGGAYLSALLRRLWLVRELLAETGTVFVHCDWHASHWIRCLLDEVFGAGAFKNEIVWRYRRWPAKTRVFQRMHDVVFWYGKREGDGHAWSPQFEALAPSTLATWGTKRQVADFSSGRRRPSQTEEETRGAPMSDVWDIGIIAPIAKERVGYPTQKPLALLRRIVEVATRPGDLVLDPFAGSGTTLVAAQELGRRWIGCDASPLAIHTSRKRLLGSGATRFAILQPTNAADVAASTGLNDVEIDVERDAKGAAIAVSIRSTAAPVAKSVRVRGKLREASWSDAVDYWAVGAAASSGAFETVWRAFRATPTSELAVRAELPALRALGQGPWVVQIVDAFGSERRVVVR